MALALQSAQKIRTMTCSVAGAWAIGVSRPLLARITNELEGFKALVNGYRAKKDKEAPQKLGRPTPALALAMLEGLAACEVGGRVRVHIEEYLEKYRPTDQSEPIIDVDQLHEEISFIRIERTHHPNIAKLVLGGTE